MARYIDRETAIKTAVEMYKVPTAIEAIELIEAMESIPTADVVEVKHGEWIIRKSIHNEEFYVCSACVTATDDIWRYCPNCGAKMDGGNAE